jgi:putative nucleotidyltransferase with HDIG domain
VRVLSDLVAEQLELPEADRDRLQWAAMLHDIGKLAVHGEFLNKPGRLSPAERDLVRRHTLEGARLVEPLSQWLGEWSLAVPEHHERHDGRGYPYGLEADEISLGGRIVAVVDAYDLMTSARSYRKPLTPDAARAEIARLSGSQFDPFVVRAFLAIPVKRLHGAQPLTWLGSVPVPTDAPGLAAFGRTAAALVVAGSVLGLASWRPWSAHNGTAALAPSTALHGSGTSQGASLDPGTATAVTRPGDARPRPTVTGRRDTRTGSKRVTTVQDVNRPGGGGQKGGAGSQSGSSGAGKSAGGSSGQGGGGSSRPSNPGDPPPGSQGGGGSSAPTTSGGSPPPTTGGSPPPTTEPPPPATTTTEPPPPERPYPATNLKAASSCENVIIGPLVNLSWTDSTSSDVTGYEILRSTDGSSYGAIAELSAGSASYTDSAVQGLGTTYWYRVGDRSPGGGAVSDTVSVTAPLTCLSGSPRARGESGGNVQQAHGGGTDGDRGHVGLGVDLDDVYSAYRAVVTDLVSGLE